MPKKKNAKSKLGMYFKATQYLQIKTYYSVHYFISFGKGWGGENKKKEKLGCTSSWS